jgi:hypothetical protein
MNTPDCRRPLVSEKLFRAAFRGEIPAEVLTTADRELLVRLLVRDGWSDEQIAGHTRMTCYTTMRIRDRLGLQPNQVRLSPPEPLWHELGGDTMGVPPHAS